jgi:hypothetical protein
MKRNVELIVLALAMMAAFYAGYNGIPLSLEALDERHARTHPPIAPSTAECIPVYVKLNATWDYWRTQLTLVSRLENYRGEWIPGVRGPDGATRCPDPLPAPEWRVFRTDGVPAMALPDPYLPEMATVYTLPGDYNVVVSYGELSAMRQIHVPSRREREKGK